MSTIEDLGANIEGFPINERFRNPLALQILGSLSFETWIFFALRLWDSLWSSILEPSREEEERSINRDNVWIPSEIPEQNMEDWMLDWLGISLEFTCPFIIISGTLSGSCQKIDRKAVSKQLQKTSPKVEMRFYPWILSTSPHAISDKENSRRIQGITHTARSLLSDLHWDLAYEWGFIFLSVSFWGLIMFYQQLIFQRYKSRIEEISIEKW